MIVRLVILSSCLLSPCASMAGESLAPLESLIDRYAQATESFQKQIKALARQCRGNQQVALAQRLERFFPKADPRLSFSTSLLQTI